MDMGVRNEGMVVNNEHKRGELKLSVDIQGAKLGKCGCKCSYRFFIECLIRKYSKPPTQENRTVPDDKLLLT